MNGNLCIEFFLELLVHISMSAVLFVARNTSGKKSVLNSAAVGQQFYHMSMLVHAGACESEKIVFVTHASCVRVCVCVHACMRPQDAE